MHQVIGLDVGGSKISAGIVDVVAGSVSERLTQPTEAGRGGDALLTDVVEMVGLLTRRLPGERPALGACVAELVDGDGVIASAHTIPWLGVALAQAFTDCTLVSVESDVRAGALAEALLGAGRHLDPFVYITVGTGISSTLVIQGRPFAGARGNALVLGTGPVRAVCPRCGERTDHVLESLSSGPALARRYAERMGMDPFTLTGERVVEAADRGEPDAVAVVMEGAEALGAATAFLINVLDPAGVILGGGLGSASGLYWETFAAGVRPLVWADGTRDLQLLQGELGPDAALLGAALYAALDPELSRPSTDSV